MEGRFKTRDFTAYLYANGNMEWEKNTGDTKRAGGKAGLGWAEGKFLVTGREEGERSEGEGGRGAATQHRLAEESVRCAHFLVLLS